MASSKSSWEKLFTYNTLVHACSGAAGSVTAMSVFYPLDTVRSRLQVEDHRKAKDTLTMIQELIQEEGVGSLYRGLQPVLISVCASNFVYFYTFHGLRAVFSKDGQSHSVWKDLFLGAVAGVINVFTTTPLWVVNTRIKMQGVKLRRGDEDLAHFPKYNGVLDGLFKIASNEGLESLWAGAVPSLVLVSNPSIQFMVYEFLKRKVLKSLEVEQLSGGHVFMLGAIAKSISTVLTYPLQLVQSKQRYGSDDVKRKRMIEIMRQIVRRNGINGMYKGLEAKLWQTVLTTALMFLCYEKIAAFVFAIMAGAPPPRKAAH